MDWIKTYILAGVMLYSVNIFAQINTISTEKKVAENDSITKLNEVRVKGVGFLKEKEIKGQKIVELTSRDIVRNSTNPTEVLRFNSPIAFRDYGNGGISTARFRGTSPTNTSVLWNGIPINNSGNGLTDFNALSINTIDEIKIVSGGASVLYGTGAIGGVVILKDKIIFEKHKDFQLFSQYGSFNTFSNFFKANLSEGKWGLKVSGSYNSSNNDYEYIDTRFKDENNNELKNENANYENYSFNTSFGYKFSNINKLYYFSSLYDGDRLFSAGIPNPSAGKERNQDFSLRNLLKWDVSFGKFNQTIKIGYLIQDYKYFNNRSFNQFSFANTKNIYVNYNLKYNISNKLQISYLLTANFSSIVTDKISEKNRRSIAMVGLLNYKPLKKTDILLSFSNEENTDFNVPVAVNIGIEQQIISSIKLKGNYSKNFRTPTFNELFWPVAGNKNLLPETSNQLELGIEAIWKGLNFQTSLFDIQIDDKILWLPTAGSILWKPKNVKNTRNSGVEMTLDYTFSIFRNHQIKIKTNYTYTLAKNLETDRRLPYAPLKFWNFNLDYNYKWFNIFIQGLQQSRSFTTEDMNEFFSINPVKVYNTGINIQVLKKEKHNIIVGGKINNITNSLYYFTNLRPNPGRNYSININYKF